MHDLDVVADAHDLFEVVADDQQAPALLAQPEDETLYRTSVSPSAAVGSSMITTSEPQPRIRYGLGPVLA